MQVYGYRMSLWAEHLGVLEPAFTNPESLECVQRVNEMAQANWEQYIAEEVTDMRAHLLPYPVQVKDEGLSLAMRLSLMLVDLFWVPNKGTCLMA
jgi:phospholipase D1/2